MQWQNDNTSKLYLLHPHLDDFEVPCVSDCPENPRLCWIMTVVITWHSAFLCCKILTLHCGLVKRMQMVGWQGRELSWERNGKIAKSNYEIIFQSRAARYSVMQEQTTHIPEAQGSFANTAVVGQQVPCLNQNSLGQSQVGEGSPNPQNQHRQVLEAASEHAAWWGQHHASLEGTLPRVRGP